MRKSVKGIQLPKSVRAVCLSYYCGQTDPLYAAGSSNRVMGREHARDCAYNLRIDFPKYDTTPTEVKRALRFFTRISEPKLYKTTEWGLI